MDFVVKIKEGRFIAVGDHIDSIFLTSGVGVMM